MCLRPIISQRVVCCVFALLCGCYPEPSDRDDDGVPDQRDNCPDVANANQLDSLRDGVGDLCRCASVRCPELRGPCIAGSRCVPSTGACLPVPSNDGTPCDDGSRCSLGDTCLGGVCRGTTPLDCPVGTTCRYGICDLASGCALIPAIAQTPCNDGNPETDVDRCDGQGRCIGTCPGELVLCDGACVDVQSNVIHCGRCGNTCDDTRICLRGVCEVVQCGTDRVLCGRLCAAILTDRQNCGRCGNACLEGQTCQWGACVTP